MASDSTIESAYFFLSPQCLQFVTVVQPSDQELRVDAPEVDYHAFDAIHLFTIKAPSPGTWIVGPDVAFAVSFLMVSRGSRRAGKLAASVARDDSLSSLASLSI